MIVLVISENKPYDVITNGIFLSLESMPTLVCYLVLSVLEHSLIGGRVFFSLGDGEWNREHSELANTKFYVRLFVNLILTNQQVDYLLHLPDWSNSIVLISN